MQPADASEDDIVHSVAARFDSIEGGSIEARCRGNRRFIEFQFTGTTLSGRMIRVDGDRITAGTVENGHMHELPPPRTSDDSPADFLWKVIAAIRPPAPSRVTRGDDLTMLPVDQDEVQFAVCESGRFWVAIASSPDRRPPPPIDPHDPQAAPGLRGNPGLVAAEFLFNFRRDPLPPSRLE